MMKDLKLNVKSLILILCIAALALSSCGYRIIGSNFLPFDSITIKPVRNTTYEPQLEERLHFALSSEFISQGIEVLPSGGDAELNVHVTEFKLNAIGVVDNKVQEQGMHVLLNAELNDKKEVIQFMSVTSPISITFQASGSVGDAIAGKERAIDRAAREIAKEIVSRIMIRYAE